MPPPTQKLPDPKPTEASLAGRGRFVGLVGVGKERYQPMVLDTLDGKIIAAANLSKVKTDTLNGVVTKGDGLANAIMTVTLGLMSMVRNRASELWKK